MRRRNIVAAVVLIVCGLAYGYFAWLLPVRSLPNTPGPWFFPLVVTALLLILSVILLVQALASEREPATASPDGETTRDGRRQAMLLLGTFVVYVALLPSLGFVLATIPFFAALMILFGERRPLVVGFGAVAMIILLYMLFRHGFDVFLPRGVLRGIVT